MTPSIQQTTECQQDINQEINLTLMPMLHAEREQNQRVRKEASTLRTMRESIRRYLKAYGGKCRNVMPWSSDWQERKFRLPVLMLLLCTLSLNAQLTSPKATATIVNAPMRRAVILPSLSRAVVPPSVIVAKLSWPESTRANYAGNRLWAWDADTGNSKLVQNLGRGTNYVWTLPSGRYRVGVQYVNTEFVGSEFSPFVFYPPDRIRELWVQSGPSVTTYTNDVLLMRYTNNPPSTKFWRFNEQTR